MGHIKKASSSLEDIRTASLQKTLSSKHFNSNLDRKLRIQLEPYQAQLSEPQYALHLQCPCRACQWLCSGSRRTSRPRQACRTSGLRCVPSTSSIQSQLLEMCGHRRLWQSNHSGISTSMWLSRCPRHSMHWVILRRPTRVDKSIQILCRRIKPLKQPDLPKSTGTCFHVSSALTSVSGSPCWCSSSQVPARNHNVLANLLRRSLMSS